VEPWLSNFIQKVGFRQSKLILFFLELSPNGMPYMCLRVDGTEGSPIGSSIKVDWIGWKNNSPTHCHIQTLDVDLVAPIFTVPILVEELQLKVAQGESNGI
jgi:hypothetical protein